MPVRFRIAVAFLVCVALTFALLVPDPWALLGFPSSGNDGGEDFVSDKIQHASAYAILTAALVAAICGSRRRVTILAASFALAHGVAGELLQRLVPDRTCDWQDVVADAAGIAAVLVAWNVWRRFAEATARRASSLSPELPAR